MNLEHAAIISLVGLFGLEAHKHFSTVAPSFEDMAADPAGHTAHLRSAELTTGLAVGAVAIVAAVALRNLLPVIMAVVVLGVTYAGYEACRATTPA